MFPIGLWVPEICCVCCRLTIHRLAARSVIRSLELEERAEGADAENTKSRIVELSVQARVSSVHTAFIGVNKDSKQAVKGPLLQRSVPVPCEFCVCVCVSVCLCLCVSSQVTYIYIALLTIQIVTKQLHSIKIGK